MARIAILGGGRQGRVVAADLAVDHEVTVADVAPPKVRGARTRKIDVTDRAALVRFLSRFDLGVGALPARLGFGAARAAVTARRSYVDVAFYAEDVQALDADAKAAGVAILPDCGLAPGLSNLVVGRALAARPRRRIAIYVAGVAADPARPYGYVATWSVPDLVDEYTRPARIIKDGKVTSVPALTGLETLAFAGIGELEAFFTDGLRTLLSVGDVEEMIEKTLRWPGHV
ncbi:MAG: saccharopine dehydrogenase NADP-binding domain-containing protein, partial [Deltaproteobacteria bacterium]|nr:saccharopine dehydrogenase NADP-binding domain-containing protein [Deltaproteobacteria bacterium]